MELNGLGALLFGNQGITYYYCKAKWKYKETKTEDMQKKVGGAKNAKLRVRIMKTEGA